MMLSSTVIMGMRGRSAVDCHGESAMKAYCTNQHAVIDQIQET